MKQITLFIAVLFCCAISLTATNTAVDSSVIMNRNVTIEKEYNPIIQDAGRINSMPSIQAPDVKKAEVSYTNFSFPMQAGYEISTMPWAMLNSIKKHDEKDGYARIGFGNYWSTLGDFAYPFIKTKTDRLDLKINHYGIFDVKMHHNTQAALSYNHSFKRTALSVGGKFGYEGFNYYGVPKLDDATSYYYNKTLSLSETGNNIIAANNEITTWDAYLGFKSLPTIKGIRFSLNSNYGYFKSTQGLTEHSINTFFNYSGEADGNRVGVDINLQNMFYVAGIGLTDNTIPNTYSVLQLNPYFNYLKGIWDIRVGVKANVSFLHGKPFSPSPDITIQSEIIKKVFYLYGGIIGAYEVNNLRNTTAVNRYIDPSLRIDDTYTPYNAFFGIKLKPGYNLLFDAYVDYRQIDNQYFFVNKLYEKELTNEKVQSNIFDVLYYDTQLFSVGLNGSYHLHDRVAVLFKGKYNNWKVNDKNVATTDVAWHMPKWEFNLGAEVKATKNLSLSLTSYVAADRFAQDATGVATPIKSIVDINLAGNYTFNSWLSAFLKINNLSGWAPTQYEFYNGYQVNGFNVLAGAIFSF
jgi:hypothetical protein